MSESVSRSEALDQSTLSVGYVGLGAMGSGMAGNLVAAHAGTNRPVTVFDLDPRAVAALTEVGANAAGSAAEVAAASDVVFCCLPYAPEVRQALFDTDGLAAAGRTDTVIIDTTTLNHLDALDIAREAAERGMQYYDCPISGGPGRAADGTLTVMFGGPQAAFDRLRPLLECIGNFIVYCGDTGSGQMMKAINNVVYDINIAAVCELMPLAIKAGLSPDSVSTVLTSASGASFASQRFVPKILDREFDGDFAMERAFKDIVNVQQIATRIGAAIPVTSAMTSVYQQTMASGHNAEAKSAMVKTYEKILGIEARREGSETSSQSEP